MCYEDKVETRYQSSSYLPECVKELLCLVGIIFSTDVQKFRTMMHISKLLNMLKNGKIRSPYVSKQMFRKV